MFVVPTNMGPGIAVQVPSGDRAENIPVGNQTPVPEGAAALQGLPASEPTETVPLDSYDEAEEVPF